MDFKEMSAVSTAGKRSMSIMESVLFEQNDPCFLYSISFRDIDIISVWTHLMAQSSCQIWFRVCKYPTTFFSSLEQSRYDVQQLVQPLQYCECWALQ